MDGCRYWLIAFLSKHSISVRFDRITYKQLNDAINDHFSREFDCCLGIAPWTHYCVSFNQKLVQKETQLIKDNLAIYQLQVARQSDDEREQKVQPVQAAKRWKHPMRATISYAFLCSFLLRRNSSWQLELQIQINGQELNLQKRI